MFCDAGGVLAYSPDTEDLERVGPLEPFVRFCVRAVLAGEDWYAAYAAGSGAADGLTVVTMV